VIGSLQIHRILYLLQTQAALLPQGLAAQKSSPAKMAVFIAACLCLPLASIHWFQCHHLLLFVFIQVPPVGPAFFRENAKLV
jgi:hypothetical protein